jgi:hypothetical protein
MDLNIVAPRRNLIVTAKAQALTPEGSTLQTSTVTYARPLPIRTDEISVAVNLTTDSDPRAAAQIYSGSPPQAHPNFLRPVKESAMQINSSYPETFTGRKLSVHQVFSTAVSISEMDAREFAAVTEVDSEFT